MSLVTISSSVIEGFSIPEFPALTSVECRLYCDTSFLPLGQDAPVNSGSPTSPSQGSAFYKSFTGTISNNNLTLPSIVVDATTDGDPPTARLSLYFVRPTTNAPIVRIEPFVSLQAFRIPPSPSPTSWGAIFADNDPGLPFEPEDGLLTRPDAAGTNVAGADLQLSGGAGTGNAIPGRLVARYPLIGASGTTVQSLSSGVYPITTNLYKSTNTTTISNTSLETSIFTGGVPGITASAGSTTTIESGISRGGTRYRITIIGNLNTTGTPTLQTKTKLNGVTIVDSTAGTLATVTNGRFWQTVDIQVQAIGASGSAAVFMSFDYSLLTSGATTKNCLVGANVPTIDFTVAQVIDVTYQFSASSASNYVAAFEVSIDREG